MRFAPVLLSLGVLALAGCQTTGGTRQPTSPGSTPASPSTTTEATPPQPSPWQLARERGMAFRAVGNEPAWTVEVEKSHSPTLHIALGYDQQRKMEVPDAKVSSDQSKGVITFSGLADNGTPVQLDIHRGQCEDNMSGQKFAASAELDVGASKYKGCGRFLMH